MAAIACFWVGAEMRERLSNATRLLDGLASKWDPEEIARGVTDTFGAILIHCLEIANITAASGQKM